MLFDRVCFNWFLVQCPDILVARLVHRGADCTLVRMQDKDQSRTNNVLVFCEQGKSASVTVLGSYLMCERKLKLPVVMGLVKEVQPAAEPNKGFARHLRFLDRAGELPEWACP